VRRNRALRLLVTITLCLTACSTASAAQSVTLSATFTPERLGQGTTIGFGFRIAAPAEEVPPPLTRVEISYPKELAFALSELGLATCSTQTLKISGPAGCPANSLMGYGTALAEIPLGPSIIHETGQVTILRTASRAGHLRLLIYVNAEDPVSAQIVFPGLVLPAAAPFGGRLAMNIPLIPSLPEGPNAAVVQFHSTIGPLHLHYHERAHGRVIRYKPKGIPLPNTCPHGGFRFSARFTFQNGSHSRASATVSCPRQGRTLGSQRPSLSYRPAHSSGGAPGVHVFVTPPPSWRRAWA
jgi:hypothetical protein